jgi:hypothetical protein
MTIYLFVFLISLTILLFLKNTGLRESITKSYIVLFLLIAISTEVLSFVGTVTYDAINLFWIVLTVVSLTLLLFLLTRNDPRASIKNWLRTLPDYGRHEAIFLLFVACVLSITLIVALFYPPNNWDSMTYHMSRVAEWIQHGSIDVYPTTNDRQTHNPPLAEFAILHLQLLSKSDRFANIIQWFSFFVSIVFVTLIAKEFQLSLKAQLFAAVVAATIPMAILESSSTQNDLVVTGFCLGFAYFLLKFVRTLSLHDASFCALSLGLALLTKGTAYIYCCAIGLTIGGAYVLSITQPKVLALLTKLAVIVIVALVLNVGHLSRTYLVYGLNATSQVDLVNEEMSMTITFSNLIRNGALHIGTPFDLVNSYSFRAVQILLGDQLNNPRSTLKTTTCCNFPKLPQTTASIPSFSLHEDYAGNLFHIVLIALAFLILPFVTVPKKRAIYCYAGSLLFGAVLYCILLKWHPWATRVHTPIFMLSVPFIAAVLAGLHSFQKQLFVSVAIILFAYSIPFLILNETRSFVALANNSILGASEPYKSYFINRPNLYTDYSAAAKIIMDEGVEEVGLCLGYDDYEYPLFVLVGRHASRGIPRFRHVGVTDLSKMKEKQNLPPPVMVLATKRLDENPLHGMGRQAEDPCLHREHTVIFDSINIRLWKLKST